MFIAQPLVPPFPPPGGGDRFSAEERRVRWTKLISLDFFFGGGGFRLAMRQLNRRSKQIWVTVTCYNGWSWMIVSISRYRSKINKQFINSRKSDYYFSKIFMQMLFCHLRCKKQLILFYDKTIKILQLFEMHDFINSKKRGIFQ